MLDFEMPLLDPNQVAEAQKAGIRELRQRRLSRLQKASRNIISDPHRTHAAKKWLQKNPDSKHDGISTIWISILEKRSPKDISAFLLGERSEFGTSGDPLSGDLDEQIRISMPPQFLSATPQTDQ